MKTLFRISIALLLFSLISCGGEQQEKPSESNNSAPNHPELFQQAIDCAALIAVNEQLAKGEMAADSQAFIWVGYTLGQANNYKVDGKLNINTQQAYSQATAQLFLQNHGSSKIIQPEKHQACIEQAKIYDPETQMQTLVEKAKRISSEGH